MSNIKVYESYHSESLGWHAWRNTSAQCTLAVKRHCFVWQDSDLSEDECIHQDRQISIRKDTIFQFADTFLVKLG